jgi:hypothetical protein
MATWSNAAKNAANDARCALVDGGYLRLYDAGRVTLIVELQLGSPAFGASSGGVASANPVAPDTVLASGTLAEYAVFASDGTTEHWGGTSVVLSPGTGEVVVTATSLTVAAGQVAALASFTVTQP